LRIEGVQTTVQLHREILSHAAFAEGRIDTTFVERSGLAQ
jgi:acetyl-CoA carboxylase, biotin carboxylase subunit